MWINIVLFTFLYELMAMNDKIIGNEKKIIFYNDEEGNTKVYASVFNPNAEPLELLPVETEREWKVIETIITSIEEENKKNNETNN